MTWKSLMASSPMIDKVRQIHYNNPVNLNLRTHLAQHVPGRVLLSR